MADKTYLKAADVFIYPSANATDGGASNSEENLAELVSKMMTSNFVVWDSTSETPDYSEEGPLAFGIEGTTLRLNPGELCIKGYTIQVSTQEVDGTIHVNLNDFIDFTNLSLSGTTYKVYAQIEYDGIGHVKGDGSSNPGSSILECLGFSIGIYPEETTPSFDNLLLGQFTLTTQNSSLIVDTDSIEFNKNKYEFIDSHVIRAPYGNIEDWVKLQMRLQDELRYYSNPEDAKDPSKNPQANLVLTNNGLNYYRNNELLFDIIKRLQFATKGGTTSAGTIGTKTNTNNGNTNAPSGVDPYYIARADHDHDSRYLLNASALTSDSTQILGTKLLVQGGIVSPRDISTTEGANADISSGRDIIAKQYIRTANAPRAQTPSQQGNYVGFLASSNGDIISGGTINSQGNITSRGDITGNRVFNAVWNDYAELYKKKDINKIYEPGTVISKVPGEDSYDSATLSNASLVVGVVSDTYGHLLGGDKDKSLEENLKEYIPVGVSGRVKVKVSEGYIVHEGDLMRVSPVPGEAIPVREERFYQRGTIIGKALESSDGSKGKILMQIMLG